MRMIPVLLAALLVVVPTTVSAETTSFTKAGAMYDSGCTAGAGTLTLDGDELRLEAFIPGCLAVGYGVTWSLSDDCGSPATTGPIFCSRLESGLRYTLQVDPDYDDNPDTVLVVHGVRENGVSTHKIVGPVFRDVPV